jgi:hypothetical protein
VNGTCLAGIQLSNRFSAQTFHKPGTGQRPRSLPHVDLHVLFEPRGHYLPAEIRPQVTVWIVRHLGQP